MHAPAAIAASNIAPIRRDLPAQLEDGHLLPHAQLGPQVQFAPQGQFFAVQDEGVLLPHAQLGPHVQFAPQGQFFAAQLTLAWLVEGTFPPTSCNRRSAVYRAPRSPRSSTITA